MKCFLCLDQIPRDAPVARRDDLPCHPGCLTAWRRGELQAPAFVRPTFAPPGPPASEGWRPRRRRGESAVVAAGDAPPIVAPPPAPEAEAPRPTRPRVRVDGPEAGRGSPHAGRPPIPQREQARIRALAEANPDASIEGLRRLFIRATGRAPSSDTVRKYCGRPTAARDGGE